MIQSPQQCGWGNLDFPGPLVQSLRFTIERQFSIRACVISLLKGACPTAVVRFVISVVVFSIQTLSGRRFSHVGVKVFEGQPSFTHNDSSTSVIFRLPNVRIMASSHHRFPQIVNPCFRHTVTWLKFHPLTLIKLGAMK